MKVDRVSIYKGSLLESCFNSLELKNAVYMSISARAVAKKFYSSIKTIVSDIVFRSRLFCRLYKDNCRSGESDWQATLNSSASVLSSYLTASDISRLLQTKQSKKTIEVSQNLDNLIKRDMAVSR